MWELMHTAVRRWRGGLSQKNFLFSPNVRVSGVSGALTDRLPATLPIHPR